MNRISNQIAKHPIASLLLFMFVVFTLGTVGVEIVRINIRFAVMTSEMAQHPLNLFPTLNGQPYADYPSLYNFLSYLASGCGRWVNRFTLALPTMLLGCYVVMMTAKTSELLKPGSGLYAALFSLLSHEYLNIFMAFSIDLPVAAAALTIVWGLLKFDFGPKALALYIPMMILSFAVRGPLGIIMCGAVTASVVIGARRWRALILYGLIGAITAAACLGLAYWAIRRQGGDELWKTTVDWQIGRRIGRNKSFFYYFTNAIVSFMPVTVFAVATLVMKRRELTEKKLAVPLLWALLPMIMLSIPGCKHLRYMTPLLPAFAIFAAIGYQESDRSYAGRTIDFLVAVMDKLILPVGVALVATGVILSFYYPADRISLYWHLAVALILLFAMYLPLCRRKEKPWPLVRCAMAMTLLVGIAMTSGDAMWENSSTFVRKAEKIAAERNGRIYIYDLDPDHDGLKVMYNLSPEARRNAVTIYRLDGAESEHLRKMFPVVPPEKAFAEIRPCDVILLHGKKKRVDDLEKEAGKTGLKIVMIDKKGRLGHKKAVAVGLEPQNSK